MSYLQCTECDHIAHESEVAPEMEWNSHLQTFESWLVCRNCHSKEGAFETAYYCDNCEELAPLIDGTDLCALCNQKAISLERDLCKLEDEHYERRSGI